MKINTIGEILRKLEYCIENKLPFSHLRFGDGGIKLLHSILFKDLEQLEIIIRKEGLPKDDILSFFELWGFYARRADYIDTPEVYFTDEFWPRLRTPTKNITKKTAERLRMWKSLYARSEFDNESYCNPESNYLMVLRQPGKRNVLDLMRGKKVCVITAKPKVKSVLTRRGYDIDVLTIVGHYQNQFLYSFKSIVKEIKHKANHYDLWLVAAGELGRLYSGLIKEHGGRTLDIGFIIEFWMGEEIHTRLRPFLCRSVDNMLELKLKTDARKYEGFI